LVRHQANIDRLVTVVQGFLSDGGTELALGTTGDLCGFSLSDLDICGVAPVGVRDADKELNISQLVMLRVYFRSLKKRMFFYISTLRSNYGARPIDLKRDLYMSESGQKLQVALPRAKERKLLQAKIDRLKDENLQVALRKSVSENRSTRQDRSPRRHIIEIDSGEDLDSESSDEDESGGDDPDLEE
jgi:hypothetical protein